MLEWVGPYSLSLLKLSFPKLPKCTPPCVECRYIEVPIHIIFLSFMTQYSIYTRDYLHKPWTVVDYCQPSHEPTLYLYTVHVQYMWTHTVHVHKKSSTVSVGGNYARVRGLDNFARWQIRDIKFSVLCKMSPFLNSGKLSREKTFTNFVVQEPPMKVNSTKCWVYCRAHLHNFFSIP